MAQAAIAESEHSTAERLFREKLDGKFFGVGGCDEDFAYSFTGLGRVFLVRNKVNKAERFFRKAVAIFRQSKEDSSVDENSFAVSLAWLSYVARLKESVDESEHLKLEELELYSLMYGKENDNIDIANCLECLADISWDKFELKKAQDLYRKSLEMKLGLHEDSDKAIVAGAQRALARLLLESCKYGEARTLFQASLDNYRHAFVEDPDCEDICASLLWMGHISFVLDQLDEASIWLMESLDRRRRRLGERAENEGIADTLYRLGKVDLEKGNIAAAEQLFSDSLRMSRAALKSIRDCSSVCNAYYGSAKVALAKGELKRAEKLSRNELNLWMKAQKRLDDPSVATSMHLLGLIQLRQGSTRNSIQWMIRALEMYRRVYKCVPRHKRIVELEQDLVKAHLELSSTSCR